MWPALRVIPVQSPVNGAVSVPGSKSSAARALVCAALAAGPSTITGVPENDDVRRLIEALKTLGAVFEERGGVVTATPPRGGLIVKGGAIDVFRSGTALRFLLPLIAFSRGEPVVIDGDARLRERPVGPLVEALRALGAAIEPLGEPGCAPLKITPVGPVSGGEVEIDAAVSSQFISALLLASPLMGGGLTVRCRGVPASRSYIDLTIAEMKRWGGVVERVNGDGGVSYRVNSEGYRPHAARIPPDASTAGYFWALAAVSGGEVTVNGLEASSPEPDMRIATALAAMGCGVSGGRGIGVRGRDALRPVDLDASLFPDGALTVAAVMACTPGESRLRGLDTLKLKESDRLAGGAELLTSLGIDARVEGESLLVRGGPRRGGRIRTHNDHRLAMAGGVLGAVTPGVEIEAPHVVGKSCPDFWRLLGVCGVRTEWTAPPVVSLIGFMGAGKTSVGKELGAAFGLPVYELDDLILARSGRDSIAAIFDLDGEERFRHLEHQTLVSVLETVVGGGGIISTGGGVVERAENRAALRSRSTVVHLSAPFETLAARLEGDATRPVWRDVDRARARFDHRANLYAQTADVTIDASSAAPREIGAEVRRIWCEGVGAW